ncbi:hypothetical protein FB451DRAFT_1183142 [Mycena latifolia]|nr:hypothetical protein FB451DRAFT_1183142 [Mycena latifolia]
MRGAVGGCLVNFASSLLIVIVVASPTSYAYILHNSLFRRDDYRPSNDLPITRPATFLSSFQSTSRPPVPSRFFLTFITPHPIPGSTSARHGGRRGISILYPASYRGPDIAVSASTDRDGNLREVQLVGGANADVAG